MCEHFQVFERQDIVENKKHATVWRAVVGYRSRAKRALRRVCRGRSWQLARSEQPDGGYVKSIWLRAGYRTLPPAKPAKLVDNAQKAVVGHLKCELSHVL